MCDHFSVGVAIGAGWQATVAYVNIGCYYLFGIPLGLILGYLVGLEVKAAVAGDRIRKWGGHTENET
ncbi:hypothetical protein CUMW_021080 [Citrus unshiu]|nr:hypothetical protein CUMW_021080 [Citrus unshiu]